MTHCTKCKHLYFEAETILRCDITHSKCYIDDLPLTVMDDCPLIDANRCVCCNAVIPEGVLVCINCEKGADT